MNHTTCDRQGVNGKCWLGQGITTARSMALQQHVAAICYHVHSLTLSKIAAPAMIVAMSTLYQRGLLANRIPTKSTW